MRHDLKCWSKEFRATAEGIKPWEFRLNDRDFHVDDILVLHEVDETTLVETGDIFTCKVMYIMYAPKFNLPDNYCIMSHYGGFLTVKQKGGT